MLLVIFGAGASYDSVPDLKPPDPPLSALRPPMQNTHYENERPPLASQLFDNRPSFVEAMKRFPQCMPLIPLLRKEGVAVEQELARFQEQAARFPQRHRQLAAIRYYLHFAIWECERVWRHRHVGITNYATLLDEIERWRFEFNQWVCFVTFNYDPMLDITMQEVLRFGIQDLNSYVSHENYMLIKLHGSTNWGRELNITASPQQFSHQRLIEEADKLPERVTDRYRIVTSHPMWMEGEKLVFPALSIPVEKKDEFSCPEAHVEVLKKMIPHVRKILTVGWRATEDKFLNLLFSNLNTTAPPDLMIVSGDVGGATETLNNLTTAGQTHGLRFSRKAEPIIDGFTGLIRRLGQLEGFLRDTAAAAFRG